MRPKTKALWDKKNQHKNDRWHLFQAVVRSVPLYPGSCVDVAPSFVFPDVTCEEYEIDTATLILRKRKAGDPQVYQVFPLHSIVKITATEMHS